RFPLPALFINTLIPTRVCLWAFPLRSNPLQGPTLRFGDFPLPALFINTLIPTRVCLWAFPLRSNPLQGPTLRFGDFPLPAQQRPMRVVFSFQLEC
ncbi:MAG TPA: hypothetical protein PKK59_08625, partial [Anaerolineaceae bacterium]|nr:hypothetical protein [Anaerolineaceae bacterium]